jgi:hypothetical protein
MTNMTRPYRIAVTGHRHLGEEATIRFVAETFRSLLAEAKREHPEGVIVFSGLAEGADTLFAEIALELSLTTEAVIAFEDFSSDFPEGPLREHYQSLKTKCRIVHQLNYRQRSDEAYWEVGKWLVDNCDLLVAAWNGQPAEGKGGTGDVVEYAKQQGRFIAHIHTIERAIIKHRQPTAGTRVNTFEEYKLFVEDTARFTDRRHSVTNIYVTVNSIILGGVALLAQSIDTFSIVWAGVIALIMTAGIIICLQWDRHIDKYKQLVGFRINQLRAMENHPEMAGCYRMYHAEDELYPRDPLGNAIPGKGLNISDRERWLPRVFMALYGCALLGLLFVLNLLI